MFRVESNRIKREFKINEGKFYASQIVNTYSGMSFVPDGNGSEFVIHFTNGEEYSSKGLRVVNAGYEGDRLAFWFEENMGVGVKLEFWVHKDENTICKQITLNQSDDRAIDFVELESIGIINSQTHFSVGVVEGNQISDYEASLGQPFYIDSLFFGSEFPATDNKIVHGTGSIKYYIGMPVGKNYACPVTVMGAAKDNTIVELKKAFFDYIETISQPNYLRFQYNSWYDHMLNIDSENIAVSFKKIQEGVEKFGLPALDAFVVDDGWVDYKAKFWSFNKKFPNKMYDINKQVQDMGSKFGMWLGPRGGYNYNMPFAKRMQRAKNGYYNKQSKDICVASARYLERLEDFLIECTTEFDIDYWKLDGFCLKPCTDASHDHMVGGENEMYFFSDLWRKWINLYTRLREVNPNLWINMTCYTNLSPWWLQWVNSIWIQNSNDIGFAKNIERQSQCDAEITYRDGRYFDALCTRAFQFPQSYIYNHEPIYGHTAKISYTDEEFEKNVFWCTVRGQALNELHLSYDMMNDAKWTSLANALNFQKDNYHILKNSQFIGGDPVDNNVYGYISWTDEGEGIIALRNPTDEKRALTLTLNKLMGAPENLNDAKRYNIYCKTVPESDEKYGYNSKMDLTLHPFEMMIFKISK
ncbi:MAG: hypothetical protein ACI4IL_05475 [Eubacterium sp.]